MRIWMLCGLALVLASTTQAGPKKKAAEVPAAVRADPNWKMLDHVEAVFALLAANQGKCDQALAAATAYVEKHKAELKALREQAQCPKTRKKKIDPRIEKRAERLGEKLSPLMFSFYDQCPDHVDRLHRGAMQFLGSKCKEEGADH